MVLRKNLWLFNFLPTLYFLFVTIFVICVLLVVLLCLNLNNKIYMIFFSHNICYRCFMVETPFWAKFSTSFLLVAGYSRFSFVFAALLRRIPGSLVCIIYYSNYLLSVWNRINWDDGLQICCMRQLRIARGKQVSWKTVALWVGTGDEQKWCYLAVFWRAIL